MPFARRSFRSFADSAFAKDGARLRPGQAMLETALAVLFITTVFLVLFQVAHMITARVLLDHAAARAARAKAVGFNDWMCVKSARVAMIPVAGKRVWPQEDLDGVSEVSRVPIYLSCENEALARGVLDYERWETMGIDVDSTSGTSPEASALVTIEIPRFYSRGGEDEPVIEMAGESRIESHFPFYMNDQGL